MAPRKSLLALLLLSLTAAAPASAALITTGDGLSATASDFNTGGAGFPPIRTIDGSGLDTGTGVHDTDAGTSWLTPNAQSPINQWIQWDLGDSYILDSIHVWNANQNTSFSTKSVDIYFSNAAIPGDPEGAESANWTKFTGASAILPQADNTGGYTGFDLETALSTALPTTAVRFVRFELNTNWPETNTYTGIAEIQFDGTVVPEPSTLALVGLAGMALLIRRRRA